MAGRGRPKGAPNKATRTLRERARIYSDDALKTLAAIMTTADSDAARVSAAKELLDRGYGKASTVLSGDEDGGPAQIVTEIVLRAAK